MKDATLFQSSHLRDGRRNKQKLIYLRMKDVAVNGAEGLLLMGLYEMDARGIPNPGKARPASSFHRFCHLDTVVSWGKGFLYFKCHRFSWILKNGVDRTNHLKLKNFSYFMYGKLISSLMHYFVWIFLQYIGLQHNMQYVWNYRHPLEYNLVGCRVSWD